MSEGGLKGLGRLVEQDSNHRLGSEDLRGWPFFAALQVGTIICVPMFALGGQLGRHASFVTLAPAALISAALIAVLTMATGYIGMRARVPTAVLVRQTFGTAGAKLLAVILVFSLLGWFALQMEMLARALADLFRVQFGLNIPVPPLTVGAGLLVSSTAIIGYRALGKLAYVAVPLLLVLVTVPLWIAFGSMDVPARLTAAPPEAPYDTGMIISILTGGFMVGIAIAPDTTRFLRTRRDVVIGPLVSLGLAFPFLLMLSASLAMLYGTGDLVGIMTKAGLGVPAVGALVLATWTSNDKNLYEAALSLSALAPKIARWKLAALAAVLGVALGAVGVLGYFIPFLVFLGIVISPVAGVYMVDYLLNARRYTQGGPAAVTLRIAPFVAWIFGSLTGMSTLAKASYGFGWWRFTTVPTMDAMIGAAVVYGLIGLARRYYAPKIITDEPA